MASQAAIEEHYDTGDAFFRAWLDETLTYSCALWDGDEDSIEAAQLRKLDYFADQLGLGPESTVLDVGCGWGSFLRRMTETGRVGHGVGLTLSPSQAAHASAAVPESAPVSYRLEGWADHRPDRPYDAIVSIGAFEHFVAPGHSTEERIREYTRFFEHCNGLLPAGGRLGLQTIALEDQAELPDSRIGEFFLQIFPESSLPRLLEIVRASESWFRLVALRADPAHYARTCRTWRRRLRDNRDAAEAAAGTETVDRYLKYLLLCDLQFTRLESTLYRITFERRPEPVDTSRLTELTFA